MNWIKFFCLFFSCLTASDSIFVQLSNEHPLLPIYVSPVKVKESPHNSAYLNQLKEVLVTDLNYNGYTKTIDTTKEGDTLSKPDQWTSSKAEKFWSDHGIYYVISLDVNQNRLNAKMLTTLNHHTKGVDGIELTGNLSTDRRKIHQLADAIHKALFNIDGIATTKILYTKQWKDPQGNYHSDLIEADWDGHNPQIIHTQGSLIVTPQYIPAKGGKTPSNFLYVSYQLGQPKLYSAATKEVHPQRMTLLQGCQLTPSISAQRDKVAFISDCLGNPDVYLLELEADGTPKEKPRRIYTFPKSTNSSPTFNPEGDKVAFVSNKDGLARIYLIPVPPKDANIRRLKPKLLTTYPRESTAPAWSPDGTKLAFCAKGDDGARQIWVYDFIREEERQLTSGPGDKENPSWAQNSLHIVFNAKENNNTTLWAINLHQHKALKLHTTPGENRYPSWAKGT